MSLYIENIVKEMMRRNLIIPDNGSAVDLMSIAENLSESKEFKDKYNSFGGLL